MWSWMVSLEIILTNGSTDRVLIIQNNLMMRQQYLLKKEQRVSLLKTYQDLPQQTSHSLTEMVIQERCNIPCKY